MSGDELLAVLENINPTLIERASRKPKRPWLRWTAVAACLALVVGLCTLFLPERADSPTNPITPSISPVKYVIYSGNPSMGEIPDEKPPLGNSSETTIPSPEVPPEEEVTPSFTYADASDLDFSYSHRTNFDNSSAARFVDLTFGGRTFRVEYARSFTNSLYKNEDPQIQLLGSFDEYKAEHLSVRFRQQDGAITFFAYTDDWSVGGPMTDEKVKELGDAFVTELFGEGFLTEYASHTIAHSSNNREQTISACYTKTICGYKTTDRVIVTYNMRGEIVGYNANTKGLFYAAENVITPEAIAAAEEYLLSHVPSKWHVGPKTLVMDASGTFYLQVRMISYRDGSCITHTMYININ